MPLTPDQSVQHSPRAAIEALRQRARTAGQRGMVVIAGSTSWCRDLAEQLWQDLSSEARLWLSRNPRYEYQVAMHRAAFYLGQEHKLVIVDAHDGFSADAFAASGGTLVGGGLMVLLSPPLTEWPGNGVANPYGSCPSRFIQYLVDCIRQDPAVLLIQQPQSIRPVEYEYSKAENRDSIAPYRSTDQQLAVETILHLSTGHRHRPLVITSDRGRGKSASLGIAAAQLLLQKPGYRIVICAPRPDACNSLFEMANNLLPKATRHNNRIEFNQGFIQFMAADALLEELPEINLLLVDEAAGLPVPILQQLLQHYSRIVFATTVHGYEGTGRGFALKFHSILDQQTPQWQALYMKQPIRWNDNDPLEHFIYRSLVLDAEIASEIEYQAITADDCWFVNIERDELVRSPELLKQLFGLLILAHYRTRPDDLYRLLDAPDIRLYALLYHSRPVAVGVVSLEGGFDEKLAQAIYLGRRRPRGHLLAQTLAFHVGVPDAAQYHYARIMRLGVLPQLQRRGIGSHLIRQMIDRLGKQEQIDAIGASFGASAGLLEFWNRVEMLPVRLGLTREHTSGVHSAVVLKPMTAAGQSVFTRARDRFLRHLPTLLAGPLDDLDNELVAKLATGMPTKEDETLTEADHQDIQSFIYGQRGYEVCAWPIEKLVKQLFRDSSELTCLSPSIKQLLSQRVLQHLDWKTVVANLQLEGRKSALQLMRQAVRQIYKQMQEGHGNSAD